MKLKKGILYEFNHRIPAPFLDRYIIIDKNINYVPQIIIPLIVTDIFKEPSLINKLYYNIDFLNSFVKNSFHKWDKS